MGRDFSTSERNGKSLFYRDTQVIHAFGAENIPYSWRPRKTVDHHCTTLSGIGERFLKKAALIRRLLSWGV